MTWTNRKTLRAALVTTLKTITLLGNDTDGTAHTIGYFEPNPRGISPFCCVDSGGWLPELPGDDTALTECHFVIGVWVRRDGGQSAAEDQIDDIALSIAQKLSAGYNAKFEGPSNSDYEDIEGVPYKFELHFVKIEY